MITKVSKDLEIEENMVRQVKNNIEKLDKRITEVQNSTICLFDVFYINSVAVAKTAAAVV